MKQRSGKGFFFYSSHKLHLDTDEEHLLCDGFYFIDAWCSLFTETFIFYFFVLIMIHTVLKERGKYFTQLVFYWNQLLNWLWNKMAIIKARLGIIKTAQKNSRRLFVLAYQFFSCSVGFYCSFSISTFEIIQPIDSGMLIKTQLSVMEHLFY